VKLEKPYSEMSEEEKDALAHHLVQQSKAAKDDCQDCQHDDAG
jgi:hypothetical protein